jgi:hypothetical protein
MTDRRPNSLLQRRELGYGIDDLPGFDTSDFRSFAGRLDPHENRLPIDRSAETRLLVVEGSLTLVWCDTTRVSTELGEGDTALTNPPAVEVLVRRRGHHLPRAGAPGLGVSKFSCVMQLCSCRLRVASNNSLCWIDHQTKGSRHAQSDNRSRSRRVRRRVQLAAGV